VNKKDIIVIKNRFLMYEKRKYFEDNIIPNTVIKENSKPISYK
jgi:hypothetical protein